MEWYFLAYKKLGDYRGRASRQELYMFLFIHVLIAGLSYNTGEFFFLGIYQVISCLPFLALLVRRLHDTNHEGILILVGLIPVVTPILLMYLVFADSDHKTNNYGIDPTSIKEENIIGNLNIPKV